MPAPDARGPRWPWVGSVLLSVAAIGTAEHCRMPGSRSGADHRSHDYPPRPVTWSARRRTAPPLHAQPPGTVRVTGLVRDRDTGAPVPGLDVVFSGAHKATARTDSDGTYVIDVVVGRYRPRILGDQVLDVVRVGRDFRATADTSGAAPTIDQLPELDIAGPRHGVDLEVTPAAVLQGVVRSPDGALVADAQVRTTLLGAEDVHPVDGTDQTLTADDGTYKLRIPARPVQLSASHPTQGGTAYQPVIDPDPGSTYTLDLELVPGCIIEGHVVRRRGTFEGGQLERASGPGQMAFSGVARFGRDGHVRFFTEEETTIVLRASAWSAPITDARTFECHSGVRYSNVVFEIPEREPSLVGSVRSVAGTPVASAQVDITSPLGDIASIERTDASGSWASYDLPSGPYQVVARVPGQGVATVETTAPQRGVALTLSGTGVLFGEVRGVLDATLTLDVDCPHEGRSYGGTVEHFSAVVQGGTFRVAGLPACRATVVGTRGPWRTPPVEVDIRPTSNAHVLLDATMLAEREIVGIVLDTNGHPVLEAVVTVRDQDAHATAITDADGRFDLRAPPGAHLVVTGAGRALTVPVPDDSSDAWEATIVLE